MAANKFATMLHRNTHKMIVILVYALLEWILIFLLFLNSIFFYLITKFAEYFGLKPPCQLCSRLDCLLNPEKTTEDSYLDLVCEQHASEISRLSYHSNHCEIKDSNQICANFSTFELEISPKIDFFTWVGENASEIGEMHDGCLSFVLLRPCLNVLDHTHNLNLIEEIIEKEEVADDYEHHMVSDVESFSFGPTTEEDFSMSLLNFKGDNAKEDVQLCDRDDESIEEVTNSCWIDYCDIDRLVPVQLIDSSTNESQISQDLQVNSEELYNEDGSMNLSEGMDFKIPVLTEVCVDEMTNEDLQVDESFKGSEEERIITRIDELIVDKDHGTEQLEEAIIGEISFIEGNDMKLHLYEKQESGAYKSLDGSVISEMDGEDEALSIEQLRLALRAEKKALRTLYTELEEERSAATIAANQTMAMIARLQEEKVEVEMEASQYQRMMEEQAEYDQEALQLLNELMLKRDKEKQELENELELYRKKVFDKPMIMRNRSGSISRSKNSSASSSNGEDSEEILSNNSPIVNKIVDYEQTIQNRKIHLSALDESLADFEEERMSILEELKSLEEKLFILADDEECPFDRLAIESNEHHQHDYIKEFNKDYTCVSLEETVVSSGFSEEPNRKIDYSAAKRLLPFFDEEERKSHSRKQNMFMDDEVDLDHMYERLMDLEADKEFLKHSISSLKKGEKGMNVLEEILQNIRSLRSVELRMRSISNGSNACSSI